LAKNDLDNGLESKEHFAIVGLDFREIKLFQGASRFRVRPEIGILCRRFAAAGVLAVSPGELMTDLSVAARKAATKPIRIVDKTFIIQGISADDDYFQMLVDGYNLGFERICRMFIGPDDVCVDLGANIGMTALMMSRFGRRVISVEGGPVIASLLASNCRSEAKIATEHCAVADYDGTINFVENSAYGGISLDGGISVPVKRLATILADHSVARLDFLKIDVEGSEWTILKDGIDIINAHRTLVFFEFNAYVQIAECRADPLGFAKWITSEFSHVYLVRPGDVPLARVPAGVEGATAILHFNIAKDGSVTDIIATNAPERLVARLSEIESQAARAESRAARAEAEIKALRATKSWRMTSPLRWARGKFP
jgi:FkbM family methyltransferase